ncbi:hypothetical protein BpHYR1_046594 [Brachionus plicatilis]|uniref:Uncharacterized protein n=1 Tax=Brachionus plicatilis TaxID=10195 RepID=A0A3M7S312_BRAPC|nr:hypothetical protein BpHYR1_046594 [Brachionus plicatilis]
MSKKTKLKNGEDLSLRKKINFNERSEPTSYATRNIDNTKILAFENGLFLSESDDNNEPSECESTTSISSSSTKEKSLALIICRSKKNVKTYKTQYHKEAKLFLKNEELKDENKKFEETIQNLKNTFTLEDIGKILSMSEIFQKLFKPNANEKTLVTLSSEYPNFFVEP